MSDDALLRLAKGLGIEIDWIDADARQQHVSAEALRPLLAALGYSADTAEQVSDSLAKLEHSQRATFLPPMLTADMEQSVSLAGFFEAGTPFNLQLEGGHRIDGILDGDAQFRAPTATGYHRMTIGEQQLTLAVAPPRCYSIADLGRDPHIWGMTAQLYSLRRPGDGGIGDTEALEILVRSAAQQGADAVGISPVHAMFSANTHHYSPYSPSSRVFFNILHSAPASILGDDMVRHAIATCGLQEEFDRLETLELIDWPAATAARLRLLRQLHDGFTTADNAFSPEYLTQDFARFREGGGEALLRHCRFEALHAAQIAAGQPYDWRQWPGELRDPDSQAVQRFALENSREVDFHAFGQWLIDRGLKRAQACAKDAGMSIGLIADLAVGAEGSGSQAWSRQAELLPAVTVGAPPDILNRAGQSWGISAFSPTGLRQHGYRAFIEMLRSNLAHAGGLRIDHVLGLKRLWVLPGGADARDGAYLNYPMQDMLRLLALESWRHKAVILGEDLGTVPEGLRETLAERGILGMRVLLFEQQHGYFIDPKNWSSQALATTTTHDLPTMRGWKRGLDIDWRERIGNTAPERAQDDRAGRQHEVSMLTGALRHALGHFPDDPTSAELLDACTAYIGMTPAPLALLPIEDAIGLEEQPNLPGDIDKHPNWRRRMPADAQTLLERPEVKARLHIMENAPH